MGSETSPGFNVRLFELADGPFRGSNVPQNVRCEGLSHERALLRRLAARRSCCPWMASSFG